jgi:hypothetical protein
MVLAPDKYRLSDTRKKGGKMSDDDGEARELAIRVAALGKRRGGATTRDNLYYDRQGKPITDSALFAKKFDDQKYRLVASTVLPDGKWISTVWMGVNHQSGRGPPLICETMVFPSKNNFEGLCSERYSTEAEALAGHKRLVEKWTPPTRRAR